MSMTGPGCPACDYRGRVPFDRDHPVPRAEIPCGACSPWSHPPDFPDAALRAKAVSIRKHGHDDPRMTAWAFDLLEYADHVDAERAHARATTCADVPLRCGR